MTNEKDANAIHKLFLEFHYADDLGVIKSKLSEYVATVRKEEREAVFKEAIEIAKGELVPEPCGELDESFNLATKDVIRKLEAVLTEK